MDLSVFCTEICSCIRRWTRMEYSHPWCRLFFCSSFVDDRSSWGRNPATVSASVPVASLLQHPTRQTITLPPLSVIANNVCKNFERISATRGGSVGNECIGQLIGRSQVACGILERGSWGRNSATVSASVPVTSLPKHPTYSIGLQYRSTPSLFWSTLLSYFKRFTMHRLMFK